MKRILTVTILLLCLALALGLSSCKGKSKKETPLDILRDVMEKTSASRENDFSALLEKALSGGSIEYAVTYGEDMPLDEWLTTRIYPAEDRLTPEKVKVASELAIAEMLRGGIVSFSDMYFFCDMTAEAVIESGIKANLSRSLVSFAPGMRIEGDSRFAETLSLVKDYHNAAEGRLKIDVSLHAENTNVESYIRDVAAYTKESGLIMQTHLSETEKEHAECIARHGMTPTAFYEACGLFASPTVCAHGVWLTDRDMDILASHRATVAHNPCSNLKLGSGVANITRLMEKGVNLSLGTDGAASNTALDLFREMYTASLLAKGIGRNPSLG